MYRKKDFMIVLKIFDVKDMMSYLLLEESFDGYFLEKVSVTTYAKLELQGKRNKAWYDVEKGEKSPPELLYWKEAKTLIYSYIKGKRTPHSFMISLKPAVEEISRLFGNQLFALFVEEQGMECLLHFRFEKGSLFVVTGTSYQNFTMDKRGEFAWDNSIKELLQKMKISFEEV